jgi:hypothetical protein
MKKLFSLSSSIIFLIGRVARASNSHALARNGVPRPSRVLRRAGMDEVCAQGKLSGCGRERNLRPPFVDADEAGFIQ